MSRREDDKDEEQLQVGRMEEKVDKEEDEKEK